MNGRLSKRIRRAAFVSGIPIATLKREYKALPYHRRKIAGIKIGTHKQALARFRSILK